MVSLKDPKATNLLGHARCDGWRIAVGDANQGDYPGTLEHPYGAAIHRNAGINCPLDDRSHPTHCASS